MKITFNSTFKSPLFHSKIQLKKHSFIYCTCNPGTKLNAAYITIHNSITALMFHWPRNVHKQTQSVAYGKQTLGWPPQVKLMFLVQTDVRYLKIQIVWVTLQHFPKYFFLSSLSLVSSSLSVKKNPNPHTFLCCTENFQSKYSFHFVNDKKLL